MKLLLVAPELVSPWTEGRKIFIRDLIPLLEKQTTLHILSTATDSTCRNFENSWPITYVQSGVKAFQLFTLHYALKKILASSARPDIVLHFPYGTFDNTRGIVNKLSVIKTNKLASSFGTPCLTVLYSMTAGDLLDLHAKAPIIATSENPNWSGAIVNVGIDLQRVYPYPHVENKKRLLFMAGYHENKSSLLASILYERGLFDIIQIGEQLANQNFSLTIALPLLAHAERRIELQTLLHKIAPSLPVNLRTQANIYELFSQHDLYLFPYRKNHRVFIPTSILEAMAVGIPVIASDLPMLLPLIGNNKQFCLSHVAGQPEDLFDIILYSNEYWEETVLRAEQARQFVEHNWNIQKSSEQIMNIMNQMVG